MFEEARSSASRARALACPLVTYLANVPRSRTHRMKTIPLSAARTLHLMAQGLLAPPRRKATKAAVLDAIRRMAQLQIDTIHVVARSPYLVLFSQIGRAHV